MAARTAVEKRHHVLVRVELAKLRHEPLQVRAVHCLHHAHVRLDQRTPRRLRRCLLAIEELPLQLALLVVAAAATAGAGELGAVE